MIVVADASPLNYLIQIDCDGLLQQLYGELFVPSGVIDELRHPLSPPAVAKWAKTPPLWVSVRIVSPRRMAGLEGLDRGESEAIQLAEDLGADRLLIDERRGRLVAERRGLQTTGTLGVLLAAARKQLVDPEAAYRLLVESTTFRVSKKVREEFFKGVSELE